MGRAGSPIDRIRRADGPRPDGPRPAGSPARGGRPGWAAPTAALCAIVLALSTYANLSCLVDDPEDFRFFPPFERGFDRNQNGHLGGEYFCIARALVEGRGFSDPFGAGTGPTSWMPPLYPAILALLLATVGDAGTVALAVVALQNLALVLTGVLTIETAARTGGAAGRWWALALFTGGLLFHFRYCFQITHDVWLVMLFVDLTLLLAPGRRGDTVPRGRALAWGGLGGLGALASPVAGALWLAMTAQAGPARRSWRPLAASLAVAAVAVAPWVARNYAVFGRLVPVKSNLFFELYQSNCLERDGLLRWETWRTHPSSDPWGAESAAYRRLGEAGYLEGCRRAFLADLGSDPLGYLAKVARRLGAATLLYAPFHAEERGWPLLASRMIHPLPFLGLLVLAARWGRASPLQSSLMIGYFAYLVPYALIAYYERYAVALLMPKVLFCYWAGEALARGWPRRGPGRHPSDGRRP